MHLFKTWEDEKKCIYDIMFLLIIEFHEQLVDSMEISTKFTVENLIKSNYQ